MNGDDASGTRSAARRPTRRSGTLVAVILLLLGLIGFLVLMPSARPSTGNEEVAEVIRLEAAGSRPTILIRRLNGSTLQLHAEPHILSGCQVGKPVRLVRHGSRLAVHEKGCQPD